MKKHSDCPSFRKCVSNHVSSVMMETSSTRCVDTRIRQRYSLSWILDRTCVKLCTTVKQRILCTSLSPCGRRGIECHSSQGHDPTFLLHVWIAPKCSVSVKRTTGWKLFRKAESFAPHTLACLCLSCCSCPCWCCCCCGCLSCRMLLHLVSSRLSPSVPFNHSSCEC